MTDATTTTTQLAEAFLRTAKRVLGCWTRQLAPLGLTPGQGRALDVVERSGDGIRMAELAGQLGIVPRSATAVVDGLQEAGLVSRRADQHDRRSMLVSLTDEGRRLASRIDVARATAAEQTFAVLEPHERDQLLAVLRRLDVESS